MILKSIYHARAEFIAGLKARCGRIRALAGSELKEDRRGSGGRQIRAVGVSDWSG